MNEPLESPPLETHGSGGDACRDVAASPDTTTLHPSLLDDDSRLVAAQNDDIDVICSSAAAEARAWADRVRAIDRMRARNVAMVAAREPSTEPKAWTIQVVARREVQFEIAGALRIPWPTAARLIDQCEMLTADLPQTLEALHRATISWAHATAMADQATNVPDDARGDFEQRLLPLAEELTAPQFRDAARRLREKLHPESISQRRDDAFSRRSVTISPDLDGMALLTAHIAAESAVAVGTRLSAIASGLDAPGDERTMTQRKADVLTDLLLTGDRFTSSDGAEHSVDGVEAKVLVTVPVETLMGCSEEPGNLEGYGPISPETARRLAARAPGFTRILTHPVTSAILDYDRSRYAVPADLKMVLRLRDETCRIIGCRKPATQCDCDHSEDFGGPAKGTTRLGNLSHLCEAHHNVKHHTTIRMRNLGDGTIEWTSAAGRVYSTRPAGDVAMSDGHAAPPPRRGWASPMPKEAIPF
jgi:hypothetical protein